jgi:glutathione S-transferase
VKVLHSPFSPFVRQVLVLAFERGLSIERVEVTVSPVERNANVAEHNPVAKLPTLILPSGETLHDSRVIIEYLDALPGGPSLLPAPSPARWQALKLQSLADALLDAAILLRYEIVLRPEALRWPAWIAGQWAKIDATLAELEHAQLDGPLDVGVIAVGCALGYLDLRFRDRPWRDTCPALAAWYARFAQRASMQATTPPVGV